MGADVDWRAACVDRWRGRHEDIADNRPTLLSRPKCTSSRKPRPLRVTHFVEIAAIESASIVPGRGVGEHR